MKTRFLMAILAPTLLLSACGTHKLAGVSTLPVMNVAGVTMTAVQADGQQSPLRLQAAPHDLMVLDFGYTTCPDICPTTLTDFHTAIQGLGKNELRVSVAFATVDRDRDTPDVLTSYMSHFGFGSNDYAIRPQNDAELETAEKAVYASSSVTKNPDGTIAVAHTAWSYVINDEGVVIDEWPFGMEPKSMTSDLKTLLGREKA